MRKCSGNNTSEGGFDSIFEITCPNFSHENEFFKDEINRKCNRCDELIHNKNSSGCGQSCSSESPHYRSRCSKFRQSKARFYGRF